MKVQIYGDSLMKGVVVDENYHYKPLAKTLLAELQEATGVETVNRAHFGYTVGKGQAVLQKDLEGGMESDFAVIEFGGNDCDFNWPEVAQSPEVVHAPHTPLEKFLGTVTQMTQALKEKGIQPVLMSLPPLDAQRYLNFIGRLGSVIDVRTRFLERRDCGQLIARDGIHLTEAGYRLLLDECRREMASL